MKLPVVRFAGAPICICVRTCLSLATVASLLLMAAPVRGQEAETRPAAPSRVVNPIDEHDLVTLKGEVRGDLTADRDMGLVEDSMPLRLLLLLTRSPEQQADLDNLMARQQQPTAAEYHKWLTPKEYGARFGASTEDIGKLSAWLESHGFEVKSVLNNGTMIDFSATAGGVRAAFQTELHSWKIADGKYMANAQEPKIPAALADVVTGIKGLTNIPARGAHTPVHSITYDEEAHRWHRSSQVAETGVKPDYHDSDGDFVETPQDFYTIYNVHPVFSGGNLGAGATVAVVEPTDMDFGKVNGSTRQATGGIVATFRHVFGVPGTLNMKVLHGAGTVKCGAPGQVPGFEEEASLDADWSNALAPSAELIFMSCDGSGPTGDGLTSAELALVDNSISDVISVSYDTPETGMVPSDYAFDDQIYSQAAAQGQTFIVAGGDSGSDTADQNTSGTAVSGFNVSALASSPLVTAAGGTDFADLYDESEGGRPQSNYWGANSPFFGDAKGYIPETAWNSSCADSIIAKSEGFSGTNFCASLGESEVGGMVVAGGGGFSTHYAQPAYQSGTPGLSSTATKRAYPDISLFAANGFWGHFLVTCDSEDSCTSPANFGGAGGTSFATPQMAGIAALLVAAQGGRQGLLNPSLYALGKAQYTGAATRTACYSNGQTNNTGLTTGLPAAACIFHDVTTGNNDVPCQAGSRDCFVDSGTTFGMLSLTNASSLKVAYPAGPEYDEATGLGSLNVSNLIKDWKQSFTSTTSLQASPTAITASRSTSLTATVTGGRPTGFKGPAPALKGSASFAAGSTALGSCTLSSGSCSISVPGSALKSGMNSVTATFQGSATYPSSTSRIVTVTVSGTASGPQVSLSANMLSFGSQSVGTTSSAKQITLTNTGNATLTITSIKVTGTDAGSFAFPDSCGTSLKAGSHCTISGDFKPAKTGALSAAITITDNAGGSPQSVSLSGTGAGTGAKPPAISFSENVVGFGTEKDGTATLWKQQTVTNIGEGALTFQSIKLTGNNVSSFSFKSDCGTGLAAGAHCTVHESFKPLKPGAATAAVTFADNTGHSPQKIYLTGTGTKP